MTTEEDTELHDLVMDTLNKNGAMGKLKAQARASIVLALEKEKRKGKGPAKEVFSRELESYLKGPEASVMFSLIREFLHHFGLEYATDVLDCESYAGDRWFKLEREELKRKLNLSDSPGPLLSQMMKSLPSVQGTTPGDVSKPLSAAINTELSQASEGDSTPKVTPRDLMETAKLSMLNLPPLDMGSKNPPKMSPDLEGKETEEKIVKLTTEDEQDEYGEDFQSTSSLSAGLVGGGKDKENLADALLATDTEEPITEDIPEDFDADDLLNSSVSGLEDLTGLETVSGVSGKSNDYMEDV